MGVNGALLSAIEVGLGSVLHGLKIPFSGQFLSLNQGFILARTSLVGRKFPHHHFLPAGVSNVSALLKSLSPAGKKLTPMLAISAQGLLFNLGTLCFGVNPLGLAVGMTLLCLWAYLQPVLIYLILYGRTLIDMAAYFLDKLNRVFSISPESLLWVLGAVILTKILLGLMIVALAYRLPEEVVSRYIQKLLSIRSKRPRKPDPPKANLYQKGLLAIQDLLNPLFVFSLVLTGLFFYFSHSSYSQAIWGMLRPLGVGFLLFFFIRVFPVEKWTKSQSRRSAFQESLHIAIKKIREL